MLFTNQMKILTELQAVDSRIDRYREKQEKLPAQLAAAERRVASAEEALKEAKDRVKEQEAGRKKLELDVEGMRSEVDKLNQQLLQVKTNKEYQALQKEIETHSKKIFAHEDDVLEMMETIEQLQNEAKEAQKELEESVRDLDDQREEIQKELKQVETAVADDVVRREEIANRVDGALLARYEKVRSGKGGIGIAKADLEEATCTMCHMDIRPQLLTELKQGDRVVICETCSRLLYTDDML